MFDRGDLQAAVEADVISADQAARLEAFVRARRMGVENDGESLRFLANLNDIFITIGILVLTAGLTVASGQVFGGFEGGVDGLSSAPARVLLPVVAALWGLAEYFCGRRRLLLPSMALALLISIYVSLSVGALIGGETVQRDIDGGFRGLATIAGVGYAFAGGWLAAALAIYLRFRLPFSFLLMAVGVAGLAYSAAVGAADIGAIYGGALSLTLGLGTLAAAIIYDARDPHRASLNSDNAFWLHFAAAPQIIVGVRGLVSGYALDADAVSSDAEAFLLIFVLAAFGALGLALNRRALIVSGLLSIAIGLGVIVDNAGSDPATTFIITALILGAGILLLGGGWRTARRMLLKVLPSNGLAGRLFPPEPA